jgi:hypothetical protein
MPSDHANSMARLSQSSYNSIWVIVVITFSIALILSVSALVYNVFRPCNISGCDKDFIEKSSQLILTVFTGAVGFLAGLFTPSPLPPRNDYKASENEKIISKKYPNEMNT